MRAVSLLRHLRLYFLSLFISICVIPTTGSAVKWVSGLELEANSLLKQLEANPNLVNNIGFMQNNIISLIRISDLRKESFTGNDPGNEVEDLVRVKIRGYMFDEPGITAPSVLDLLLEAKSDPVAEGMGEYMNLQLYELDLFWDRLLAREVNRQHLRRLSAQIRSLEDGEQYKLSWLAAETLISYGDSTPHADAAFERMLLLLSDATSLDFNSETTNTALYFVTTCLEAGIKAPSGMTDDLVTRLKTKLLEILRRPRALAAIEEKTNFGKNLQSFLKAAAPSRRSWIIESSHLATSSALGEVGDGIGTAMFTQLTFDFDDSLPLDDAEEAAVDQLLECFLGEATYLGVERRKLRPTYAIGEMISLLYKGMSLGQATISKALSIAEQPNWPPLNAGFDKSFGSEALRAFTLAQSGRCGVMGLRGRLPPRSSEP